MFCCRTEGETEGLILGNRRGREELQAAYLVFEKYFLIVRYATKLMTKT